MIHGAIVSDVTNWMAGENFQVVEMDEEIDAMWGIEHRVLTDDDIKALKEGKALYSNDCEYAQLITYKEA